MALIELERARADAAAAAAAAEAAAAETEQLRASETSAREAVHALDADLRESKRLAEAQEAASSAQVAAVSSQLQAEAAAKLEAQKKEREARAAHQESDVINEERMAMMEAQLGEVVAKLEAQAAEAARAHAAALVDAEARGAHRATTDERSAADVAMEAAVAQARAEAELVWHSREQQLTHEIACATHNSDSKADDALLAVTTGVLAGEVARLEAEAAAERRATELQIQAHEEETAEARGAAQAAVERGAALQSRVTDLEARVVGLAASSPGFDSPTREMPTRDMSTSTDFEAEAEPDAAALRLELQRAMALLDGKSRSEAYLRHQLEIQEAKTEEATIKASAFREALELAQIVRGTTVAQPAPRPVGSWVVPKPSGSGDGLVDLLFERGGWRRSC